MGLTNDVKLRWFLIGFFESAEGWNWECPFDVNNVRDDIRTLKDHFRVFLEYLEENSEFAKKLLRYFERCLKEEREQLKDLDGLVNKIMEKLEDEGQIKKK